jgi:cysteine-rich repeat protein
MFQACATVRFKLGSMLCGAVVFIACGTASGPVPTDSEPEGDAGAPVDVDDLDATDRGAGGNVSTKQSNSSNVSSGGAGTVASTVSVSTASGSPHGPVDNPGRCGVDPRCAELEDGPACTDPIAAGESYVLGGDDFAAEFRGDVELTELEGCAFGETGASDAVLSVELEANDQLVVTQKGELDAVFALLSSCSTQERGCIESEYGGRGTALTYTAATDEKLLLVVDASLVQPTTASYEIWIDVNPECGNGVLEALEECDDANLLEGDGCSPSCRVEFPWGCDGSPSECDLFPSLGSVRAGEPISPIPFGDPFDVDDRLYYTVTFEERVLLDLSAKTRTQDTGDVDVYFYSDWDSVANHSNISGDDVRVGLPFEPGTYLVEIAAKTDLPEGFDVELTAKSAGVCGDSEKSPFEACDNGGQLGCEDCTVGLEYACDFASPSICTELTDWQHAFGESFTVASATGTRFYWMVELAQDAVLSGNVTSAGDPYYEYAEFVALWASNGKIYNDDDDKVDYDGNLPTWSVGAGRYKLEFHAPTGFPDGYTLTLTLATP